MLSKKLFATAFLVCGLTAGQAFAQTAPAVGAATNGAANAVNAAGAIPPASNAQGQMQSGAQAAANAQGQTQAATNPPANAAANGAASSTKGAANAGTNGTATPLANGAGNTVNNASANKANNAPGMFPVAPAAPGQFQNRAQAGAMFPSIPAANANVQGTAPGAVQGNMQANPAIAAPINPQAQVNLRNNLGIQVNAGIGSPFKDNRPDQWRYRSDNGHWWYWTPDNRWMWYNGTQWNYFNQPSAGAATTNQSVP